ncbi:hypothetical protein [Magnetospirillum molischianum]|uniref:LexA repressor DNA-binding domain-containing protein n=1 Tax=Magnetospirillum molischianum DSM 120 TaxID=1150626 RepID=H8FY41_MAGML|nr:hypothetical protein [Magnetospirillum molischianum]CCG43279.1 conserved hypothetical protein [Magnetospirillum molischianum DSM 120]
MSGTLMMSQKQIAIIRAIMRGNAEGDFVDLDELLKLLPYTTTKQSLQFSIRALIKHGLIEKRPREVRRGRARRVLAPTLLAYRLMGEGIPGT